MTLHVGVEAALRDEIPEFETLRLVVGAAMTTQQISMESVVVGRSARMRAVFEFLRVIGNSDSTVLVTGESGTGKEVTATLIHQNSRRRHHPFVAVSCALFSETLIESELFGHERGAFTGAIKDRPGRFETGRGRHHLPRRHRRRAAVDAGEAAARAAEPDGRAGRRDAHGPRQRARHRRHQARPEAAGRRKASSARTCTTASTCCR